MGTKRFQLGAVLALGAAAALALSSCSSSGSTSGGTSGSSDTPASTGAASPAAGSPSATAKGDPIKLMVIYDETGPGASPELVDGATAGVQEVNANGGVNGRQLQLLSCKTGNDPNKADDCARKAVSEKVSAIVGELTLQKGHEKILEQAHIPLIGSVTSGTDLTEPAQFPITGSTAVEIPALANAFVALGKKKVSLARIQIDGGEAFAGFANAGLKAKGLKVVNDVPVPIGAADMAPYVQQVLANGTDAVMVILPGADSTAFLKELHKEAPNMTAALVGTQKEKVADALGSASNGLIEGLAFLPPAYKNSATEAYVAAMTKAGFKETRGFRLHSYTAVQVFAAVAKKVADPTSQAMWDQLPKTSGIDVGLTPPLQWTKGGVGGLSRVFTSCDFIVKYENGKEVPVFDTFKDAYTFQNCPTPAKG